MSRMLSSILMIGTLGYFGYRYRYRLLNVMIGTGWLRRLAVGSVMSMPGIRNKMMNTVFGGPSEW
ncbi:MULTISPECIES: hypothetical protein [unclassified Bacillus (in: firmicutes)]|uniref:hypothetical protein n=1 Tax=unclassified Bacillus (in: firmicutes) TaxID=185979 RepID=UPI0008EF634A|nr:MULTISPECIES: hypothetical protein [unclassified Bacillus (in: firmicutes)]SFA96214.1 hypothetical protein SAMN02799634_103152 [Bacillus sp. UNCCL13]SFQ79666.1 hypothetical protein SAMN04488577_1785 [Bacillus sp. cl95]